MQFLHGVVRLLPQLFPSRSRGAGTRVADAFRGKHKSLQAMIRKLPSGGYRLYSRKPDPRRGKRRNLGTFDTRVQAQRHERAVQYFKRRG